MQAGGGDAQVRDPGAGGQDAQKRGPGDGTPIRGASGSLDMLVLAPAVHALQRWKPSLWAHSHSGGSFLV